jgi:hypothetical protein
MTDSDSPQFSAEDNARDAALWRELSSKVRQCLDSSSNGYTDIFGGSDNLSAQVQYQSRGRSGMQLTLSWTADNELREDFGAALLAMRAEGLQRQAAQEAHEASARGTDSQASDEPAADPALQPVPGESRQALPPGTRIRYAGMEALVVEDHGGHALVVDCEGSRVRWYWQFDGETCVVLSLPA